MFLEHIFLSAMEVRLEHAKSCLEKLPDSVTHRRKSVASWVLDSITGSTSESNVGDVAQRPTPPVTSASGRMGSSVSGAFTHDAVNGVRGSGPRVAVSCLALFRGERHVRRHWRRGNC